MDVAHAILLYGKIDFSRLTADYLSAKFEDNTYTVEGVAEDLYNFEHLTLDGWKKIVEIGNNIAYDLQKKGEVRPYTWKANIHATIHE